MIKTRLVGLLSHAKKYIVYTILWQWAALLSQVIAVFTIADLLERVVYGAVTATAVKRTVFKIGRSTRLISRRVLLPILKTVV